MGRTKLHAKVKWPQGFPPVSVAEQQPTAVAPASTSANVCTNGPPPSTDESCNGSTPVAVASLDLCRTVDGLEHVDGATFDELGLNEEMTIFVSAEGAKTPSTFHCQVLKPFIDGQDIMAEGRCTRKLTVVFIVGVFHRLDTEKALCQAMFIAATRGSAQEIASLVSECGRAP